MTENEVIVKRLVKELSEKDKFDIIRAMSEVELHIELEALLNEMYPHSNIQITHGNDEFGRDLVMFTEDPLGDRLMAFVVKTGDISGRTLGKIDDIKSQLEQAFAHPITLKGFEAHGELQITSITIIISGEISSNGNKRLNWEINRPIQRPNVSVRDLKWLADNFTTYYPYAFYEGKVSEYLERNLKQLETKHMFSNKHLSLSECYIDPTIAAYKETIELTDSNITLTLIADPKSLKHFEREIQPNHKILVVGDPGVGKSTTLVKIAIDMLQSSLSQATKTKKKEKTSIPIFLSAREFWQLNNVQELVDKYGPPSEAIDRFSIDVLLIDGLDEADSDCQEALLTKAANFMNELHSALVVSTRKIDIVKKETLGYEKREVLPFEFSQALAMLGRLVNDEGKLEALKDGLKRIQGQIPITPLSLLMLVELVEDNREVPASITDLYDRFTDTALGMYDKTRKGIEVLFNYQVKKKFLAELAFQEFFKKDRFQIPKADLNIFLQAYAKEYKWDAQQLLAFVHEIERAGIVNLRDNVIFTHRSFLDYFIAVKINDIREEIPSLNQFVACIYHNDNWSDVALYYAGLRTKITQAFLDALYKYGEQDADLLTTVRKTLAGRILQASWHSTSNVKIYGIGKSLGYCDQVVKDFLTRSRKKKSSTPAIYADLYGNILCEMSFGSTFLINESKTLIDQYLQKDTSKSLLKSIRLLWAVRKKLPSEERIALVDRLYGAVNKSPNITGEDYAKSLLLLRVLAYGDEDVFKKIEKRIRLELRDHPQLFTMVAPIKSRPSITKEEREKARVKKKKSK